MRPRASWFLLLWLSAGVAVAQQAYNPLPKLVVHAKYVLVTTYQGYDLSSPNVMPDDKQAVLNVQDAIKKWGRYDLAYRTKDADLILLVRKGRIVEAQPGMQIGVGSTMKPEIGPHVPVDVGDPRDMLAMYDGSKGIDSAPLWRNSEKGGLDTPEMELMEELRQAVEKAAKVP
jgi:hypothetical protein